MWVKSKEYLKVKILAAWAAFTALVADVWEALMDFFGGW